MSLDFGGLSRLLPFTTSHDPDLSQSLSLSQKHIALLDRRDGAHSRIKLHCVSSKREKNTEKEGRISPFSQLQQLQRPGVLLSLAGRGCRRGELGTETGTVSADRLIGAVSVLPTREKGDVSLQELSKCWKLPSASSIEDLPPTSPIHNPGRWGERESCSRCGEWSNKRLHV